ncbi:MAG: chromosomal replication initiator protein DnaA, partial [Paludibacteraceae bacterium]|nr:chromosomal replication initiator protein DnaA [Paludibacteraceae bacterium]
EVEQLWKNCLQIFSDNLDKRAYETWFAPIVPCEYANNTLILQIPSHFFVETLEKNYADLMLKTMKRVFGPNVRLKYRTQVDKGNDKAVLEETATTGHRKSSALEFDSHLSYNYHFDNFIEGDCNRLPRTAGINVASQPGKTAFNPLFIYGKSGVGKTHLANAIGLKTKELHPQKKVLFVSANQFQLQFTEASRNSQINNFINFYQTVDMLIIDDVHEFGEGKKTSTQNALFHIFNYLQQAGKQLIFTCDKKPAELNGFDARILSRFHWGLTAEMTAPDAVTRRAILDVLVEKDGIEMPDDVKDYLANHITDNIRSLEGAVISLVAQSTIGGQAINLALAKTTVGNLVAVKDHQHTVQSIRDLVCDYFKIPVDILLSSSRKREVVQARQVAMYFAKKMTKDSLATIGNVIGKRNHATVLHAFSTVKDLIDTDKLFRAQVDEIERKLNA